MTIDKKAVDGFGFDDTARTFRFLRAKFNAWRGMEYVEMDICEEQKKILINMARQEEWQELKKVVMTWVAKKLKGE